MTRLHTTEVAIAVLTVTLAFPLANAAATVDRTPGIDTASDLGLFGTADDGTMLPSVNADGRYVVFHSEQGFVNDVLDVFLYTLGDTAPIRMSQLAGVEGNKASALPVISGDGSIVVFESLADDLGPADDDGFWDAFVYRVAGGELAAVSPIGSAAPSDVFDLGPYGATGFIDVRPGSFYEDGVGFLSANGVHTASPMCPTASTTAWPLPG